MSTSRRRVAVAAVLVVAVTVMASSAASAATFTLTLTGPTTGVVGQPLVLHAGGTDPTDQGALYLEVDEISGSVASTCPSDYLAASQLATSTGGRLIALDQRENLD